MVKARAVGWGLWRSWPEDQDSGRRSQNLKQGVRVLFPSPVWQLSADAESRHGQSCYLALEVPTLVEVNTCFIYGAPTLWPGSVLGAFS